MCLTPEKTELTDILTLQLHEYHTGESAGFKLTVLLNSRLKDGSGFYSSSCGALAVFILKHN